MRGWESTLSAAASGSAAELLRIPDLDAAPSFRRSTGNSLMASDAFLPLPDPVCEPRTDGLVVFPLDGVVVVGVGVALTLINISNPGCSAKNMNHTMDITPMQATTPSPNMPPVCL